MTLSSACTQTTCASGVVDVGYGGVCHVQRLYDLDTDAWLPIYAAVFCGTQNAECDHFLEMFVYISLSRLQNCLIVNTVTLVFCRCLE